ncbi:MAG: hypothetical protein ABUT39_03260 [Acidobacteriota bacterium]
MKRYLLAALDSPGWLVLLVPLAAVLGLTLFGDGAARPPDQGDEPTYALQASSLAWDFDLKYAEEDYQRYFEQWGARPKGIDLDSPDGGHTQVFARPFYHALLTVPFVRVMPYRGIRVANALLLAAASILAAWALGRHFGSAAPVWVAVFVFASVAFSHVFLATADVFLLAVTAIGFALVYAGQPEPPLSSMYQGPRSWSAGTLGRWLAIGALLAIPGTYRLPYVLLLVPAAVALQKSLQSLRAIAWTGLILGAGLVFALTSFVQTLAGGEPFWSLSGLRPTLDAGLLLWSGIYFLIGRSVGLLPYFLPALLAFAAFRSDRGRWALLAAAGLGALAFLVLRPYDFAGVGGGVGNRLFLPLYAALWFLPGRPLRASWAVVTAALAAPILFPIWTHPAAPEPSRLALWLPYEATQKDLPGDWISYGGIRVKPTSPNVWRAERGSDLRIAGDETGGLVAASVEPLEGLVLDFDRNAPSRLIANGQELKPTVLRPDGSVSFEIPLGSARTHPMGWSGGDAHVYQVSFRLPEAPAKPIGFRIHASRDVVIQRSGEGR